MYEIGFIEVILTPIYILVLLALGRRRFEKYKETQPAYEFFMQGLYLKMFGAVSLCLVYLYYYKGGDTINYMESARTVARLGAQKPGVFLDILFNGMNKEMYSHFNNAIGYPVYYYTKIEEWRVIRYSMPFCLLGFNFYIPASIILAYVSYLGNFRLYLVFAEVFPKIYQKLAIPILFIPSTVFWGSGILKDTYTYSAVGWLIYGFYHAFIRRENIRNNLISIVLASIVILGIKPYIFIALLPGALIWLNFERLQSIRSTFLRTITMPVLLLGFGGGGLIIMTQLGASFGDKYSSVDKALQTAVVTQRDLKRAEYQGASFDIGEFDPTLGGIASKIPAAITAGLFRPFIWEARNPVMLISGLENLLFLGLTLRLFFSIGIFGFFGRIARSPLLIFALIFSLFFAFAVGLSTSNFGSLVRYKIPCEPFYLGMLFVLLYTDKDDFLNRYEREELEEAEREEKEKQEKKDKLKNLRSDTGFIVK